MIELTGEMVSIIHIILKHMEVYVWNHKVDIE